MIEELLPNLTTARGVASILGFSLLLLWLRKLQVSRNIHRLGSRAPIFQTWLPFDIDFIYKSVKAHSEHRDLEFWEETITSARGLSTADAAPTTAESNATMLPRLILTMDPENIKAILATQFSDYGKGEKFHYDFGEFLGDSIFATDGELWSRSRHLIRPMFVRERIVDTEIFEKHVQKLIPLLGGSISPSGSRGIDIAPLFFRYTLDAATDYLLGQGTDSLDNPATEFAEAFRYVLSRQGDFGRMGPFRHLISRKRFRQELKKMDNFLEPYIQSVLSLDADELDQHLSKRDTFLHALARFTRDPRVLRDQLVAILLAGRDTTAATLSFCLFELSRHPEVVAKLRSEIEARLGLGVNGRKPTYSDLKDLKYLNVVLNETMRLYPVVPFNIRCSLRDTTLPSGGGPDGLSPIGVRKGTGIVYSTMVMQRRADLYDPPGSPNYFNPKKWLPDRWLSGWQPKPWQFIPFNGGPRICIGQQFAIIEMGYTLTRILQAFKEVVALPPQGKEKVEDPVLRFEITLSPGSEMNCAFVRQN